MCNESEWLVCGPHWSTAEYGSMEVRWRSDSPWSTGLGCSVRDASPWRPVGTRPVGTAALNWSPAHPAWPHRCPTPWEEHLLCLPGLARAALKAILVGWLLSYPWVWNSPKPWDHKEPASKSLLDGCQRASELIHSQPAEDTVAPHFICWFAFSWDIPLTWPAPSITGNKRR